MRNRLYYSINKDSFGNERVHCLGLVWLNDEGEYVHSEYTGLYLSLNEFNYYIEKNSLFEYLDERTSYMGTVLINKVKSTFDNYHNGTPGTNLPINDISKVVKPGNYWSYI